MTTRTPGDWSISEETYEDAILVSDEQGVMIAHVWRQPLDPPEWAEGNARLIAAAPDLLEALRTCRDLIASADNPDDYGWGTDSLIAADAAIARATNPQ